MSRITAGKLKLREWSPLRGRCGVSLILSPMGFPECGCYDQGEDERCVRVHLDISLGSDAAYDGTCLHALCACTDLAPRNSFVWPSAGIRAIVL
jgi:hypothetical protein